jgi:hypothetical protein
MLAVVWLGRPALVVERRAVAGARLAARITRTRLAGLVGRILVAAAVGRVATAAAIPAVAFAGRARAQPVALALGQRQLEIELGVRPLGSQPQGLFEGLLVAASSSAAALARWASKRAVPAL